MSPVALLLTLGCAVWALFVPVTAACVWLALLFAWWLVAGVSPKMGSPPRRDLLPLSDREYETFRRHFYFFGYPYAAVDVAWTLNAMRFLSAAVGIALAFFGHLLLGMAFGVPMIAFASTIVALNPAPWLIRPAERGNAYAQQELRNLSVIAEMWAEHEQEWQKARAAGPHAVVAWLDTGRRRGSPSRS